MEENIIELFPPGMIVLSPLEFNLEETSTSWIGFNLDPETAGVLSKSLREGVRILYFEDIDGVKDTIDIIDFPTDIRDNAIKGDDEDMNINEVIVMLMEGTKLIDTSKFKLKDKGELLMVSANLDVDKKIIFVELFKINK